MGTPANGTYDLRFKLYDGPNVGTGTLLGAPVDHSAVSVTNGIFTVTLNFGEAVFDGSPRFLEMAVRPSGGSEPYDLLTPRVQVTSTPHAIRSLNSAQLEGKPSTSFLQYDASGRVGIGTANPASPLHVNGDLRYEGTLNKLDVKDSFTATVRAADFLFGHSSRRGSPGKAMVDFSDRLHFNFADEWPYTILGGDVGVGTAAPVARLHVETDSPNKAAVYGKATANNSVGVYGESSTGTAVHAQGNATQTRDRGGFAKAMLFIAGDGSIVRCYNGLTGSDTGGCGFAVTKLDREYRINFGFPVNDRFVLVTPGRSGNARTGVNVSYNRFGENQIGVLIFPADDPFGTDSFSAELTVIVY